MPINIVNLRGYKFYNIIYNFLELNCCYLYIWLYISKNNMYNVSVRKCYGKNHMEGLGLDVE